MASANLQAELECSICLNIYTDPVTLRCAHNFCRGCIDRVLDTQERSGSYSCPECREKFQDWPALQKNIKLRNIVENFLSAQPDPKESKVFCTYCVDSPITAVKSCLLCEASLCDKHLSVHSKSPEHVLCDPTTTLRNRKCSVHNELFKYYCTEDSACICVSCCLIGEHKGHQMESLDEASEKRKEALKNVLSILTTARESKEERVRSLWKHSRKVQEQAAGETKRATALFKELRKRLEDLEKRVLRKISGQAEKICHSTNDFIQQLEIEKDELSRKMRHIEELCNTTDPLTVLQESDTGDRKVASRTENSQNHPQSPERFQDRAQVMSKQSFSSGRHYWDVDVKGSRRSRVGLCYPSIDRRGELSRIGSNKKSWGMAVEYDFFSQLARSLFTHHNKRHGNTSVIHDNKEISLPAKISGGKIRIYLDYEAGQISFYDLCSSIRHIHTFTATFTEPLHAALWVDYGCLKISGGKEDHKM
ncbi:E3 ubiquitin/ISG15 ligase TRIM25-like [Rana temporaria]|uniref:E3 ubiquitin/ISG15 ligase TRIM25-like n=1 Tax=Rana temporaria TaxID=8407 RepID=UPI001AAD7556|nr:E3 ubiquitin/ISG15 ligase TRIM25-like [Rana temporaria]